MSTTASLALHVNRDLIDASFEGYKLSAHRPVLHRTPLPAAVWQCAPDSGTQFSEHHTRHLALHNHLCVDEWYPTSPASYLFLCDGRLLRVQAADDKRPECTCVLQIGTRNVCSNQLSPMPPSIVFLSKCCAAVSDGQSTLHIVDTGDRERRGCEGAWHVRQTLEGAVQEHAFLLLAGRCDDNALALATCHVSGTIDGASVAPAGRTTANVLSWLQLARASDSNSSTYWTMAERYTLATGGNINYTHVQLGTCDTSACLCVAADQALCVVSQCTDGRQSAESVTEKAEEETGRVAGTYVWGQHAHEVTVTVELGSDAEGVAVNISRQRLEVRSRESATHICGQLFAAVKCDECTWTVDGATLEIVLVKADTGRVWSELLLGDTEGAAQKQGQQAVTAADLPCGGLADTTVCTDAVEECDALPSDSAALLVFRHPHTQPTQRACLGANQFLIGRIHQAVSDDSKQPAPAFCVRHHVDALVWQPLLAPSGEWSCKHVGTLNAFGYVQASKQTRRFTLCSPDMRVAAVADTHTHVYLYRQQCPLPGELRNRRSGQRVRSMCEQLVLSLDTHQPIVGVALFNTCVVIATPESVYSFTY